MRLLLVFFCLSQIIISMIIIQELNNEIEKNAVYFRSTSTSRFMKQMQMLKNAVNEIFYVHGNNKSRVNYAFRITDCL